MAELHVLTIPTLMGNLEMSRNSKVVKKDWKSMGIKGIVHPKMKIGIIY